MEFGSFRILQIEAEWFSLKTATEKTNTGFLYFY